MAVIGCGVSPASSTNNPTADSKGAFGQQVITATSSVVPDVNTADRERGWLLLSPATHMTTIFAAAAAQVDDG